MDVFNIELKFEYGGQLTYLYPCVIMQGKNCYLTDCGYKHSLTQISTQLLARGVKMEDLTGIIITHDDIDHVGGLYEIRKAFPMIKIYCSETEAPYISGELTSLRLKQAEELFEQLTEEQRGWALEFQKSLREIKRVKADIIMPDDSDFGDGIKIIHTPGHTPGHISIYFPEERLLIAGDAVVYEDGELEIANPGYTLNLPAALASVKKLSKLPIEKLYCYHGGLVEDEIHEKFVRLLEKYTEE